MSDLKNIFIGDRVVQRVYVNDALLYQADSWENTPVTKQFSYKTPLLFTNSIAGTKALFNSKNEMYILDYGMKDSYAYFRIAKIDSGTGNILYSLVTNISPLVRYSEVFGSSMNAPDKIPAYIDNKDVIHVIYSSRTDVAQNIHLLNITDSGKSFILEDGSVPDVLVNGVMSSICFDDNCFYVCTNSSYVVAVNYKCSNAERLNITTGSFMSMIATTTDNNYLYGIDTNKAVIQFDKRTGLSKKLSIPFNSSYYNKITVDNMGNIYLYGTRWDTNNGYYVGKYSPINNTFTTVSYVDSAYSLTLGLAFDSRNNMYTYNIDRLYGAGTGYYGTRFNSSFKLDWRATDFANAITNNSYVFGDVCVDKYDNIYYVIPTSDNSSSSIRGYAIYKYYNLEQVQNS